MVKVLITGASGLLGGYLMRMIPQRQVDGMATEDAADVYVTQHKTAVGFNQDKILHCDVSKRDFLNDLINLNPDVIIHCAANGDVDQVERNPAGAVHSDLMAVVNLIQYNKVSRCQLITISSNAVYSGTRGQYTSDDRHNPVNVYGKIKSLADDVVRNSNTDWCIIRPMMLFGYSMGGRTNWVERLIKDESTEYRLANDYMIQPTYAKCVARFIWEMVLNGEAFQKEFNLAGPDKMSLFELGRAVTEVFDTNPLRIQPTTLAELNVAPRGLDTTLTSDKKLCAFDKALNSMK